GVQDRGDVPVGVLLDVEAFVKSPVGVRVAVPFHHRIRVDRAPDVLDIGIAAAAGALLQDAVAGVVPVAGGTCVLGNAAAQSVIGVGDQDGRAVLGLDQVVPSVEDQSVAVVVGAQITIGVVGQVAAADGGDLVLLVVGAAIGGGS